MSLEDVEVGEFVFRRVSREKEPEGTLAQATEVTVAYTIEDGWFSDAELRDLRNAIEPAMTKVAAPSKVVVCERVTIFAGQQIQQLLNDVLTIYLSFKGANIVAKAAETLTSEVVKVVTKWAEEKLKSKKKRCGP